ncbi:MAG TPA: RraA family protein [Bryobacteraceae bacterium]|nr:RraA family protein [Bryobacteraceae bacterium]
MSENLLAFLRNTDTCSVSNAIETFKVRTRNEGYIQGQTHSMDRKLGPVAGYAVTARMRAASPPVSGLCYYQRSDWWQYIAGMPGPKIVVVEDLDMGAGALFGEIHARIGSALGCLGYVTNGTVRDLAAVHAMGFHCFASGSAVSHSYAHITEFGQPVTIGGLQISSGDLLHGDCNGVHSIPFEIAEQLPPVVAEIRKHEAELIALCARQDFSLEKLEELLDQSRDWSPQPGTA